MKKFILGTDWWTDCDDCVALRLLSRAHKLSEAKLLGVVINACMPYSAASLDGFLTLDGISDIPIGIDTEATDFGGKPPYQANLAPHATKYRSNLDAEDPVKLYRRLLEASDTPTEIIEIGYLQVFANLLDSPPDEISEKSGLELVREKVTRVWCMAGKWDADGEKENNFARNPRAVFGARKFLQSCPVPITLLGFEVGFDVLSGTDLSDGDHLRQALKDHGSETGRSSWDPMLTLLALVGDAELAGYKEIRGTASLDTEGRNYFEISDTGMHSYVVKTRPNDFYKNSINELL